MSDQINEAKLFTYPERVKSLLEGTGDIVLIDGRRITPSQIWQFMTEEGPRRFPYAFDTRMFHAGRISCDVDFLSGIKYAYIGLTWRDRLLAARKKGIPLVLSEGGSQPRDIYYAAGAVPLRPGVLSQWARDMEEGLDLHQADFRHTAIMDKGRGPITIEACNQIAAHTAIKERILDVDMVAPLLCLRCSDMAYLVESYRGSRQDIPLHLIDFPVNDQANKEWAVEYLASALRRLTSSISQLTGVKVTEDDLMGEIKLHNKMRKLARDIHELWWSADVPPTNSVDFGGIRTFGSDPCGVDLCSAIDLLEETRREIQKRVKNSIKGAGLIDDPVRLYVCGSCVGPNPAVVERSGGVVVGSDDWSSGFFVNVKEDGDPYVNLSTATLSLPYERPTEARAQWVAEQVRKSRADGLISIHNWGCNFQSAVSRMVADIVKQETGIPAINIEVAELDKVEAQEQSQNRVETFIEMLQ
ncbi:MAG: 2-hydroxyacyl-CoA dehydratase family protein [Thaumarchaeota archaeon]|nr:2-hydroxyacyl-CoA dehydratase family protein [Nitrososphaerota archaeon]MCL5319016.1 2-hydroxyacyl-CoA dehydratase family protein [Nitrososphaerota archaeon]